MHPRSPTRDNRFRATSEGGASVPSKAKEREPQIHCTACLYKVLVSRNTPQTLAQRSPLQSHAHVIHIPAILAISAAVLVLAIGAHAVTVPTAPLRWLKSERVLLVSIDGWHQSDLEWWITNYPKSAIAEIYGRSLSYSNALSSRPSDFFPGLLAMVTGGAVYSHGVWYDDSYDPTLYPPGSNCTGTPGTEVVFDESIDRNSSDIHGGGGIDPAALPRRLAANKTCVPVYPHSYVKVNTIFEVAKSKGLITGWADKHLAYGLVNGPLGAGVDDLPMLEIASADGTTNGTRAYDQLHIDAVVNWIHEKSSDGKIKLKEVPRLFGCNRQTVSVTQKLPAGGYVNGTTPSPLLLSVFKYVDDFFKQINEALQASDKYEKTMFVISAKHGQSPSGLWLGGANTAAANLFNASSNNAVVALTKDALAYMGVIANTSDPRAPNVVILPSKGTVYTGGWVTSTLKIDNAVETRQIAPTILKALGLDHTELQAVQIEGTEALPGIGYL
ncbi:hypothetical protein M427DRAFT_72645 [Gonapodya prolifera JEL478]|uniref:Type I phosphodiesterase/nucleotide pyrophosphatase n=1 Tax=Gonapodya prolifera (strain JEL478) TaxID=1344416 RepID=A0A139A4T2_GONPJ|nr:hypothetical protein M427DRAFT_72645 [Gonapodya prolifera JEL478]|eukprot:KXS11744.1 hypothetical protein M427DRAFT_72645 [Gonapodya prolifera JEL478]